MRSGIRWLIVVAGVVGAIPNLSHAEETLAEGKLEAAFTLFPRRPSVVGTWRVVSDSGRLTLLVEGDFSAKKGPDVKFFLSPTEAKDVTDDNATAGSQCVARLDRFQGPQRFPLPPGVALETYRSLVLHCEAYSKLWGMSALGAIDPAPPSSGSAGTAD